MHAIQVTELSYVDDMVIFRSTEGNLQGNVNNILNEPLKGINLECDMKKTIITRGHKNAIHVKIETKTIKKSQ